MPLLMKGVYVESDDKAYEYESTYYLRFQIKSALACLAHFDSYSDSCDWDNRCEYYHFYADHLLYSMGQISNRFVHCNGDTTIDTERTTRNCSNYFFSEKDYPILSKKLARNTIEHLEQYNNLIIANSRAVGGFNVIDDETDPSVVDTLRNRRDAHPYTLDLLRKELLIRKKKDDLTISLESLREELLTLKENVDSFMEFLKIP